MSPIFRWRSRAWAAGMLMLTVAGCSQDRVPTAPLQTGKLRSTADKQPFYYYEGEKIPLTEDPRRIVVSTLGGQTPTMSDARVALDGLGVSVDSMLVLSQVPGHAVLTIGSSNSGVAALARDRLQAQRQFAFVSPAYTTTIGHDDVLLVDRVIVHFKPGVTRAQIDSLNAALGTSIVAAPRPDSGRLEYWLAYPRDSVAPWRVAAQLSNNALVAWADPDKISNRRPTFVPTDPYFVDQFYLKNTTNVLNGVPVDIDVEPAWDLTRGGNGIHVAVIGDGVDMTQQDLSAALTGAQGIDELSAPGRTDDEFHPFGNDMHGTAVAGIIAASQSNGKGGAGIAPTVTLNVARIFRGDYPIAGGTKQVATDAQIASAITWAWETVHSDVLNNSWGGGSPSTAITNAINAATTSGRGGKGSVVVFSAGNTSQRSIGVIGTVLYPASLSTVVSVSAIDRTGALTDYSPEGGHISVVAPSGHFTGACVGEIVTTDMWGAPGCSDGPGSDVNFTSTFSGTSAAAPQVSAVAALLLAVKPTMLGSSVQSAITANAIPWGSASQYGAGKLDAGKVLGPIATVSGPGLITEAGLYTWTTSVTGGFGAYSYQWQESFDNGAHWTNFGTNSSSFTQNINSNGSFWLRVNVTADGVTNSSSPFPVTVQFQQCGPGGC